MQDLSKRLKRLCDVMSSAQRQGSQMVVWRDDLSTLAEAVRALAFAKLTEAQLDTMHHNHRLMAKMLADLGRERDEAIAFINKVAPMRWKVRNHGRHL